jgi:hypothetical protein
MMRLKKCRLPSKKHITEVTGLAALEDRGVPGHGQADIGGGIRRTGHASIRPRLALSAIWPLASS